MLSMDVTFRGKGTCRENVVMRVEEIEATEAICKKNLLKVSDKEWNNQLFRTI